MGTIAVVLVVVLLVYSAAFPHHTPPVAPAGTLPPTASTPSTVPVTASVGVSVPESGGGSVTVAAAAVALAKNATYAFYSGRWAGIPEAAGFTPPPGDGTRAVIDSFAANEPSGAGVVFSFVARPRAGAGTQTLEVIVSSSNGLSWFVSYVAAT